MNSVEFLCFQGFSQRILVLGFLVWSLAVHRIQYENGEEAPTTQAATYLGARVQYNGDHKAEVKAIINAAWVTVMKLDLFWRKAPVIF